MKSTTAYLGLGSNIGDRMAHMRDAIDMLHSADGIDIIRISPVYQTEPVGYEAQEDFYNMVVEINTSLFPNRLLEVVKEIEKNLGRRESVHKGPREMDIDILLYGKKAVEEYRLTIPHPRMLSREFVLRPLYDIAPDLSIPSRGVSVHDALTKIEGEKRVIRVEEKIELSEVTGD
ncbi:MAG: 2-amino-4-hydroxy-6-hydroxymethyldihydropteridine diphosphokinase [Candidatus Zixiibacteriota bacterium]